MFSLEPPRTPYDLAFRMFGIPIRIHPGFWIAAFIFGFGVSEGGKRPLPVVLFIGIEFISILVHELGHALLMRRYGYAPRIVLYHLGGLAIRDEGFAGGLSRRSRHDAWQSILISLAGPGAGFLLAAVVVVVVFAAGGEVRFSALSFPPIFWSVSDPEGSTEAVHYAIRFFLFINIFWGLINLVPVLPLDGGQVARELLTHRDPYHGLVQAIHLSIVMGIVLGVFFFIALDEKFVALMFALLAVSNYLTLQQLGRNW